MDTYDNLHSVISRAIWDAFKPGAEPPDADMLAKAVRGQLQLYLHMSMYPQYEELVGVIDEEAFVESLVQEFWEKRAVKQTGGNYLLFLCLKPTIRSVLKPMKSLGGVNFYSPLLTCGFAEKPPYFAPLSFS